MDEKDKFSASIEAVIDKARDPEGARNILALLFPKVERAIQTYVPSEQQSETERTRKLRASTKEFSSIYFGLDPSRATWGIDELASLLDYEPHAFFREIVGRIEAAPDRDRPRLRRLFLDALNGAFADQREFDEAWLDAIVEVSPYFLASKDEVTPHLFAVENEDRLRWLLVSAFEPLSVPRRAELLAAVIPQAKDLSLLCEFVRGILGDKNPEGAKDGSRRASLDAESERIRELLLTRVRDVAKAGELWSQARVATVIWFWWGAVTNGEVREFTDGALATDVGRRCLMDISVSLVRSSAGDYERVSQSWSKIVDLERLKAAAEYYKSSGTERDQTLASRFLAALKRGQDRSF